MGSFDIKFETNFSKNKNKDSFTLTFVPRNHSIALGYYVIYPSLSHRELVFMPKFRFDSFNKRFAELSEKVRLSKKEIKDDVKSKNRKYTLTESEVKEFQQLRCIISNSYCFAISGSETSVTLPYKFMEILGNKADFLTFVQTDLNEFLIINPVDAWMYSTYDYSENVSRPIFNKLRKAI